MKKSILYMSLLTAALTLAFCGEARAADRDTPQRAGDTVSLTAGEALDAGVIAGVWTNGQAYAATTAKALTIIGRTENEAAPGAAVTLRRGVFLWDNGDTVASKDIGATVYVWTNTAYTVCLTPLSAAATNSVGTVSAVESSGAVWVRSGF